MKQKIKNYSIHFIKEMIPVVIGILIALSIDNWNQSRKDKKYSEEIFALINSELNETLESIKETTPKQKALVDTIEVYASNKDVSILQSVLKAKGIYIATVKMNAWNAFSNSKIELVDYKKLTALSNIEEQKELLKLKSETLMNLILTNSSDNNENQKNVFKMMLMDIIQTQKTMQRDIEAYLKK